MPAQLWGISAWLHRWRFRILRFRAWFRHFDSAGIVRKIPKSEGRRRLEDQGYRQVNDMGSHPSLEWWARPGGFPVTIPGDAQTYDAEALEAILSGK